MPFLIGYGVAILGIIVAYQLSKGKPRRNKNIIWGLSLMIPIAPFFSFAVGLSYAFIVRNGWAVGIMFYIFPILFLVGMVLFLFGIFSKKDSIHHEG